MLPFQRSKTRAQTTRIFTPKSNVETISYANVTLYFVQKKTPNSVILNTGIITATSAAVTRWRGLRRVTGSQTAALFPLFKATPIATHAKDG